MTALEKQVGCAARHGQRSAQCRLRCCWLVDAMSCETPRSTRRVSALTFASKLRFFAAAISDHYTTAAGGVHVKQFVWLLSFGSRRSGRRLRRSCQGFAAVRPRNLCSIIIARAQP
jgi:hypothetical protein